MSKRLSLSLSSNPSGISSSPKPSIFSSLLANKTNSNLKSTQSNSPENNSGSRHATTPKKIFNLDSENDEIDLVNHTANDYEFSTSKSAKVQLKKNVKEINNSPASGSKSPVNSTPNKKASQKSETANTNAREKPSQVSTQNSSFSSSPTKSQPSRPMLSPPSSPIKIRKLESLSSDSFDEFDDNVKAKVLESDDSEDDFDAPVNTSHVSNKVNNSVESIDSSPIQSPKQKRSPIKSQVSSTSVPSSQQTVKPKQSSQPISTQTKQLEKPKDTIVDEDTPWQSKPSKAADKAKSKQEVQEQAESKEVQSKVIEPKSKTAEETNQTKEQAVPTSAPSVVNRRLLQVAFDSPTKPSQEPVKPKPVTEEKPRPLSLFGNRSNAITLNSDDDFMPTSQPVTKPSTKLSLASMAKSEDKSAKKDSTNKVEATKEVKRKPEPASEKKKTPPKKSEAKQTQITNAKLAPSKPKIQLGSKDVPLNIGSDSSFEIESPVKKKEVKEPAKEQPKQTSTPIASQTPKFSIADLTRARSERIKQKEMPSSGTSADEKEHPHKETVATIRSKEREFPIATEEDREKFIQWSIEEYKGALAKGSKSSGEDNFTEDQVKEWSKAKITAWKLRHTNPNTYYYRFTDLGVLQHNGKFTVEEHTRWMKRYIEFKLHDWPIGNYWGVFSKALPHRVGYQCASYFRSLLKHGVIVDNSVKVPKGDNQDEEVQVEEPTKSYNVLLPEDELGLMSVWKTKETKEEESKINQWICEYHNLDLSSHNEKSENEVSPSSGGSKKRKAEDELTPDNMNKSPVEQSNKKRKIASPIGTTATIDQFFAVSKKTTPTQPSKSKSKYVAPINIEIIVALSNPRNRQPLHPDRAIVRAAVASAKTKSPIVSPSSLKQQDLSRFFSGVSSVSTNLLQQLMESGKIPPPDMVRLGKPPMGLEWPRMITPYLGEGDMSGVKVTGYNYASSQLPKIAWDEVESAGPFFALLLDPPLRPKENDGKTYGKGYVTIDDVQTWIKVSNSLVPKGFLFVWIEKEFISDIIRLAKKWKFLYVENLMWMKKHVNNKMMEEESEYFNKSKLSLILFRKGHGDMELRHQRNPDVVEYPSLETKDDVEGMRCEKPMEYVYNMIETLLPEANFNSTTGKGRMLEVWASKNAKRKGWTHIYIEPSSAADLRESMDSLNNSMQVVEDSDSDDDILMQSAQNESELFGEEKSSDSLFDSDVEAVLDKPSSHERSSDQNNNNNNNNDDDDDVVMVSNVNRPEIIIEDESNDNEVKMNEAKQPIVVEDEEKSDRESAEKDENITDNKGEDEMDQLESGSINDDDLDDFWNALTND